MSYRHSCDRCRQQKVRCLQDESQGGNKSTTGRTFFSRCERCTKAGVDCVYSLKQRSNHSSVQPAVRRDVNAESNSTKGKSWFGHCLFYPDGTGAGPDFSDISDPLPGLDDSETVPGLNGWDANIQLFSPISPLRSLPGPPVTDTVGETWDTQTISTGQLPTTTDDGEDDENTANALSLQLMALSQRTMRAMRRLAHPDCAPLAVSSPEVNETFEDTNTLIRIINYITATLSDRDDITFDPVTTNQGLVFLALTSHQYLVGLFRAICDAIHRRLGSMALGNGNHQKQQQQQSLEPSSVAQFVMVLQLLMHLTNRLDRSLFPVNKAVAYGSESTGGQPTPVTPNTGLPRDTHPFLIEAGVQSRPGRGSLPQTALPVLAQAIVRAIPDEHEKLRQVIKDLQAKIEHSELH